MFPDIILVGLKNTLIYTALAFVVGLSGGLLLALMKLSTFPLYRWIATGYIEFFRGVPALLVFIAFGYGVPLAFGVSVGRQHRGDGVPGHGGLRLHRRDPPRRPAGCAEGPDGSRPVPGHAACGGPWCPS